jgi:hypothetical protein
MGAGAVRPLRRAATATETLRVGYFSLPPHVIESGSAEAALPSPIWTRFSTGRAQGGLPELPLSRLLNLLRDQQLDAALILARTTSEPVICLSRDPLP